MTELRQRMINQMTLRGFSPRTHKSYLAAVAGLARHYKQRPDQLNADQIQAYLVYLERERGLAWSSLNITACGLRFFYGQTLKRKPVAMEIPRRQAQKRLPEVLSRSEVDRLLGVVGNVKHRTLLMTTYAAGLRVSEVVRLRVSDIDSTRMTIRVEQGKGSKDRYTILSPRLLDQLRHYWRAYQPTLWLFPGAEASRPLDVTAAQKVFNRAKQSAAIQKGHGIHTLRHCFATHLLEAGVDLATIQALLGHTDIRTTMRYLQIRRHRFASRPGPLDLLALPRETPDT